MMSATSEAQAADLVVAPAPQVAVTPAQAVVVAPASIVLDPPKPPRRRLTTYMAKYPFGVLREDYTPLGQYGVSKRDYYGPRIMYATLHVAQRVKVVKRRTVAARTVLRVRY